MDVLTTGRTMGIIIAVAVGLPLLVVAMCSMDMSDVFSHSGSSSSYYDSSDSGYDDEMGRPAERTIEDELSDFLGEWRGTIESQNLRHFMMLYHPDTNCRDLNYQELETYQGNLFDEFLEIDLTLSDATYSIEGDRICLRFIQKTKMDYYADMGVVVMVLVRGENRFQIIEETWDRYYP